MKKKEKNRKNNHQKKFIIDVSEKKEISIIEYDIGEINEEEFKNMLKELDDLNKKVKVAYYSSNEAINKVNGRCFFDLLKLFFLRLSNSTNKAKT